MTKLTDTQLIVLSKAAAREDGAAELPSKFNGAGATKVAASLVAKKLMREMRSKPGIPVWRTDLDDRSFSLIILKAGRDAIGVVDEGEAGMEQVPDQTVSARIQDVKRGRKNPSPAKALDVSVSAQGQKLATSATTSPRAGTKHSMVITMLTSRQGATLDALVDATGWLPHTTRAFLTGLRKRGYDIERTRLEGSSSFYRIAGHISSTAA